MRQSSPYLLNLNRAESNALKGIALLLLLWHHLFFISNGIFDDIRLYKSIYLINTSALACKICVALFVFLSGYGLAASYEKSDKIPLVQFYVHRFIKLFSNYWLIWLLFVPIGIFCFGLSLDEIYGDHIYSKLGLEFLGMSYICGYYGINPTWWFYSCIIVLYMLFPCLIYICRRNLISASILLLCSCLLVYFPIPFLRFINNYILPFVLGILCRNILSTNILSSIINRLKTNRSQCLWLILLIIFLLLFTAYNCLMSKLQNIGVTHSILIISLILTYKIMPKTNKIQKSLEHLGHHSFYIFLFHTFFQIYFLQLVYWTRNPLLIYCTFLAVCMITSIGIEKLKKLSGFEKKTAYLESLIILNPKKAIA